MASQHVLLHEGRACDSFLIRRRPVRTIPFILSYYSIPVKAKRRYCFTNFYKI